MLSSLFLNRVSIDPSAVGGVEVAVVVINQSQLVVRVLTGKSEFIGMDHVSFCRKHASEGRVFVARLSFMLFLSLIHIYLGHMACSVLRAVAASSGPVWTLKSAMMKNSVQKARSSSRATTSSLSLEGTVSPVSYTHLRCLPRGGQWPCPGQ